jgi:hypothetical protein
VVKFAPRISLQLRAHIERLAESSLSAAEITREVGKTAEGLGQTRPSYEQVRTLVREVRRRPKSPSTADVLLDIAFRAKPADALLRADPPRRRTY